ncbi:uncharacterized protein [Dysidea avara]|uniref:uncharacterized protein n=1 Tax=Dysidea avara TaxID=196820 RepID=UPI00331BD335
MFCVGDEFASYNDLKDKVSVFERTEFVQLNVQRSRTIDSAVRRAPSKVYNENLRYTEIDFVCSQGGKKFKTASKGERPNQWTFQRECPFSLKLSCSRDGQVLAVRSVVNEHNHEISENTFRHYPKQRRMEGQLLEETENMLSVKGNKKMVQQYIVEKAGKVVTLKDLQNISDRIKDKSVVSVNTLVDEIRKIDGAIVEVSKDDNNVLASIFFQTKSWQNTYEQFPELILIDATYKLNNLNMPLYIIMVVDGNGESEVVALWLVVNEDKVTISRMMDSFVKHCDTSKNVSLGDHH